MMLHDTIDWMFLTHMKVLIANALYTGSILLLLLLLFDILLYYSIIH